MTHDNERCPGQNPQDGTCPEPAIQFRPEAWEPRRFGLPGGGFALAVSTGDGVMVLMPVRTDEAPDPAFQAEATEPQATPYGIVRRELLAGPGTAMVTGQPNTKRCCAQLRDDAVLLKTWTPEYLAERRAENPGAQDDQYLPIMVTALDAHSGKTACAIIDIEDAKQLHNRLSEVIAATESAAGRI